MVQKMGVNPSTKAWFLGVVYLNGGWNFNRCALVIAWFFPKKGWSSIYQPTGFVVPIKKDVAYL